MKLKSQILTSSKAFKENMREHLKDIEKITEIAKKNSLGGSQFSRDRHSKRGKMLPRDRVSGLLDIGSYFLEIGSFDIDINDRLQVLEVNEPPERKPGIKVDDVEALVNKLKNEAKVL